MVSKKRKAAPAPELADVTTSLALPAQLWRTVRMLALQRSSSARQIVIDALEREVARLKAEGK